MRRSTTRSGPKRAALVIRDGKSLGVYNQARLRTGGTFFTWLKERAGEQPNYRMLLADGSPFTVELPFADGVRSVLTKDDQLLEGKVRVRLKVDVENLENLLGLMRGQALLHVGDFERLIADQVFTRVMVPQVKTHTAEQVRGNQGFQDKLRAESIREIEAAYGDVGVLVEDFAVDWELSEEEKSRIESRLAGIAEDREIEAHERALRSTERQTELESAKEELERNAQHQSELKSIIQQKEAALANAASEIEQQKAQLDLRKVQIEMEAFEAEHRRLQARLDREQQIALEEQDTLSALELKRKKREIEREDDHLRAQADHNRKMQTDEAERRHETDLVDRYRDLTPDQLLAIQAEKSPELARAMAEKFRAEAAQAADAAQRSHEMAMEHGDQVARAASGLPTGQNKATCSSCKREIDLTWSVCPYCAKKIKI